MIDAHCHLNDPALLPQLPELLARMRAAGVEGALVVGYDLASSQCAVALAKDHPGLLYAAVGVHPHESQTLNAATLEALRALAHHPGVVAIGEIGLDFHYNHSPRDVQRDAFARQLALAAECHLPVVIHEREAAEEAMGIMEREGGWGLGGCWHCCSTTPDLAIAIARFLYIGIAGWLTFPKADNIRALAHAVTLDRLIIESDAPYLAPVPHRGKPNEPSFVPLTAHALATLKGVTVPDVENATRINMRRAFPRWGM